MSGSKILLIVLPVLLSGFARSAVADSAGQTDWSGGPGVLGPVIDWSNEFYLATNIDWSSIPGDIQLQLQIIKHTVEDGDYVNCLFVEDVDGDGDMDVLGSGSGGITWWENEDSSGTAWTKHTVDDSFLGALCVHSADIDNDGDMDILGAASSDNDITWWENIYGSGTSWTEHTVDTYFAGANNVYSEDIDDDGDMDIIGAAFYANEITWWENDDGSGMLWTEHTITEDFIDPRFIYPEDIDGDGDLDVLGASCVDKFKWWENVDGSGTSWTEHIVDGDAYEPWCVYSEDLDGDGDMDVLGGVGVGWWGYISWWENINGSGTSWTEHTVDGDYHLPLNVYSEDMDNDGDMDVISSAIIYGVVTWWENDGGSGTSWIEHTVDPSFAAKAVYTEDIDGDGNTDVLGARFSGNDVIWWDLTPQGWLESSILDTECSPQWASIDWNSSEPAGTDLYFQYRTSDDPGSMGIWSDPIYEPCLLSGLLNRYFQYMVLLETDDPGSTPSLNDVTLNWDPLGVEGESQVTEYTLHGAEPNPSYGSASITFAVPELSPVKLLVYDLAGHLVLAPAQAEYTPGVHQVQLEELTPGIYFCRMVAGEFTATQRFMVIE